ncbi:MAG: hypothetical protein EBE86_025140 [Hormoscilla sp. GUM202]|nr:hypothetical protein [Hormoscilla sp. GUM202]
MDNYQISCHLKSPKAEFDAGQKLLPEWEKPLRGICGAIQAMNELGEEENDSRQVEWIRKH